MKATRLGKAVRRLPWGLVGMVALVWACEAALSRRSLDFSDMTNVSWKMSSRAATAEAARHDILFFGDSQLKMGVAPGVIERITGRKVYNLAVNAAAPPASYFLLRRALESGARPSAVVFEVSPTCLGLAANHPNYLNWWSELLSFRESVELDWALGDADHFAALTAARIFPSVRYRVQIRDDILAGLRGLAEPSRPSVLPLVRNMHRNKGALIIPSHAQPPRSLDNIENVPAWRGLFFPDEKAGNPTNLAYIRKFLNLADAYNVPVYWLLPPINPQFQAKRDELGHEAYVTRFVSAMLRRHPSLTVIDGRWTGYQIDRFWDFLNHLDGPGALAFSSDVATILKDHGTASDRPRWIRMPAYRERPLGPPLEDTAQSAVVLKEGRNRAVR